MRLPTPRKNCPYCGGTNLRAKEWRSRGTWFVACGDCKATGPSMARTPQEACDLFDRRAVVTEAMTLDVMPGFVAQPTMGVR